MDIVTKENAKLAGDKFYFTGVCCKYGHFSQRYVSTRQCTECNRLRHEINKEEINKKSNINYHKNKEFYSLQDKKYYKKNSEKIKIKAKEYAQKNVEKIKEYQKRYIKTAAGKEAIRRREKKIKDKKPWMYASRSLISNVLKRTGRRKTARRTDMAGYDEDKLRQRIEINFKDGMSWDNYGKWHIDHTKPVNAFVINGVTDLKLINSLCNLKPMWAADNIRKKDKWPYTKS